MTTSGGRPGGGGGEGARRAESRWHCNLTGMFPNMGTTPHVRSEGCPPFEKKSIAKRVGAGARTVIEYSERRSAGRVRSGQRATRVPVEYQCPVID